MNDSFLFQLRDTARTEPNYRMRKLLKDAADKIEMALKATAALPTVNNMQELNGSWALGVRVLKEVTRPDNGVSAGRMAVPQEERKAA